MPKGRRKSGRMLHSNNYHDGGCHDTAKRIKIKVRDQHRQLFDFYLSFRFDTVRRHSLPGDPTGYSPLECFVYHDSRGRLLPCREPEVLTCVFEGKQHVNLQIKMWCEGVIEGTFLIPEIQSY